MILLLICILIYFSIILLAVVISMNPFRTPLFLSPGALGMPQDSVELTNSSKQTLRAWWVRNPESQYTVLLLHGYMMNRSEPATTAKWFYERGYSVFLFDFRAHGRSDGKRCDFGWAEADDVHTALSWLDENAPGQEIMIWGSSMGAAAAVFCLKQRPRKIAALILDSAYSRLSNAVVGWWNFILGSRAGKLLFPTKFLAPLFLSRPIREYDVASALREFDAIPILLLHGDSDRLVPMAEASRIALVHLAILSGLQAAIIPKLDGNVQRNMRLL
jgi:alpha-beta hydrolase superfamily lysophospholipase